MMATRLVAATVTALGLAGPAAAQSPATAGADDPATR